MTVNNIYNNKAAIDKETIQVKKWTLIGFTILVFFYFRPFASFTSNYVWLQIFLSIFWIPTLFHRFDAGRRPWHLVLKGWPVALFCGVSILSAAWAIDVYQTMRSLLPLIAVYGLSLALWARLDEQDILKITYNALTITLFISIAVALVIPRIGVHQSSDAIQWVHAGKWRGVFAHKNAFGQLAAIHFIMTLSMREMFALKRIYYLLMIASASLGLLMAGSASALVAVAMGLAVAAGMRLRRPARLAFIGGAAIVAISAAIAGFDPLQMVASTLGRDVTLTGRTEAWNFVLEAVKAYWPLGVGFGNQSLLTDSFTAHFSAAFMDAHSGYLDAALGLGIFGFVAVAAILWRIIWLAVQGHLQTKERVAMMSVLVAWCIFAITEVAPFRPESVSFVCATIFLTGIFTRARTKPVHPITATGPEFRSDYSLKAGEKT
ncbi:O-antigen ligase family protein [Devosia sediminis]|uniref:O-antigen ligase family protein n=1 Tax=Devosia sediminis TaxID=2798801 RepID=A0A934MPA8_9HYPH|nr:O-antigen ligase family protein [Devosia sediminis]MBJ3783124.1 O-antigen ligase family protein [Devosia sediminis]